MRITSSRTELKRDLRFALLAICVVGILAVTSVVQLFKIVSATGEYQLASEKSAAERSLVRDLVIFAQEAELSARKYLQTGKSGHYADFKRARQRLEPRVRDLLSTFAANDLQRSLSRQIATLVDSRTQRLSLQIAQYQTEGRKAAEQFGEDPTVQAMETVRRLADSLIASERREIGAISQGVGSELQWSRNLMLALMVTLTALVAGVAAAVLGYLTHRTRIEEQLIHARKSAEAANEAKSDFLASMSHEIRTPLTSILGYTELLMDHRLGPSQRQAVQKIQISGAALLALLNDILDFSKIEAGEVVLSKDPVSLKSIVADALTIVSPNITKKGLSLNQEIDSCLPEIVLADGTHLKQVLLNILSNAVKFTDSGSVTLRVRSVGSSPLGDLIRFEVEDTGIGIAPEDRRKLFQRFSQIDGTSHRKSGGTGLGLAISHKLVSLMEGEIGFESTPGNGSTFWFFVPLEAATERAMQNVMPVAARESVGGRVLLVEDSMQNQDLVRTILNRAGYTVELASDGEEALAKISGANFDLVLMDMQMPKMGGLEATRRIRAMAAPARDVPIVALTANLLPDHVEVFAQSGINDHIGKPFRRHSLVETVDRWAALRDARTQSADASEIAIQTPVHDQDAFREARSLMGSEWTKACLLRLLGNLEFLLREDEGLATLPTVPDLKRRSHQIVSDAGQLGFADLSRSCAGLEKACNRRDGVEAAVEKAREAAFTALGEIKLLLPSMSGVRNDQV